MNEYISDPRRTVLAVLAFVAGGAVPIQLVTLSFGYAQYARGIPKGPELLPTAHAFAEGYTPVLYIPALALLAGIALYSRRRWPDLFRRIVVGLAAGAIGTLARTSASSTPPSGESGAPTGRPRLGAPCGC